MSVKKIFINRIYVFIILILVILSCTEDDHLGYKSNKTIDKALLELSGKTIFFGHQSVGKNVIDGIESLNKDVLYIKDLRDVNLINVGNENAFYHNVIGRNTYPEEKIEDFIKLLNVNTIAKIDIAFMKFCYVDIGYQSSPEKIYEMYKNSIEKLEKKYKDTAFIYLTIPLTARETDIKSILKRLLGKYTSGKEGNIKRSIFNNILREEKKSTGRLFDIAEIESTCPDGSREKFLVDGIAYESLVKDYTDDGGHLNDLGKKIVAEKLILFLHEL